MKSENFIFLKPVMTEKVLIGQENGKYAFWVNKSANKFQIANIFERLFGIKPLKITTILVKGKVKTDWKHRLPIQKPDRKKAIIAIPKDKKIDSLILKTK